MPHFLAVSNELHNVQIVNWEKSKGLLSRGASETGKICLCLELHWWLASTGAMSIDAKVLIERRASLRSLLGKGWLRMRPPGASDLSIIMMASPNAGSTRC